MAAIKCSRCLPHTIDGSSGVSSSPNDNIVHSLGRCHLARRFACVTQNFYFTSKTRVLENESLFFLVPFHSVEFLSTRYCPSISVHTHTMGPRTVAVGWGVEEKDSYNSKRHFNDVVESWRESGEVNVRVECRIIKFINGFCSTYN